MLSALSPWDPALLLIEGRGSKPRATRSKTRGNMGQLQGRICKEIAWLKMMGVYREMSLIRDGDTLLGLST